MGDWPKSCGYKRTITMKGNGLLYPPAGECEATCVGGDLVAPVGKWGTDETIDWCPVCGPTDDDEGER